MTRWQNERGSVAFYTIGLLAVTAVLLFFLYNMIKIYAAGQQATTSAEQAVIAATNVMFEEVYEAVTDDSYMSTLEARAEYLEDRLDSDEELTEAQIERFNEELDAIEDILDFSDDVEDEKDNVLGTGAYKNQASMAAIDRMLTERLEQSLLSHDHSIYTTFRTRVQQRLYYARGTISSAARDIVGQNAGETSETIILMFNSDNRIEVQTAAKYEESNYEGLFTSGSENIEQTAAGPSVQFIDYLSWINGPIY